jgi:hypothetical protein
MDRSSDPADLPGVGSGAEPPTVPFKEQKSTSTPVVETPVREPSDVTSVPSSTGTRDRIIAAVLGLVVVVAAAGIVLKWIPLPFGGAEPEQPAVVGGSGTLVVNALPWARVVEITNAEGETIDIGDSRFTPLVLSLEPGSYRIVLSNDGSDERVIEATVAPGETTTELVPLNEITAEDVLDSLGLVE